MTGHPFGHVQPRTDSRIVKGARPSMPGTSSLHGVIGCSVSSLGCSALAPTNARSEPRRVRPDPACLPGVPCGRPRPRSGLLRQHHPLNNAAREGAFQAPRRRTCSTLVSPAIRPRTASFRRVQIESVGSMIAVSIKPMTSTWRATRGTCPRAARRDGHRRRRGRVPADHADPLDRLRRPEPPPRAERDRPDRVPAGHQPDHAAARAGGPCLRQPRRGRSPGANR